MAIVYLGLGSNVGDRELAIQKALAALEKAGLRTRTVSPLYETTPLEKAKAPLFLDAIYEAWTDLTPRKLLELCQTIEKDLGRVVGAAGTECPMDIDILLYGREVVEEPDLVIPHPKIPERRFILAPLSMLVPWLTLPKWDKTAAELLAEAPPEEVHPWRAVTA